MAFSQAMTANGSVVAGIDTLGNHGGNEFEDVGPDGAGHDFGRCDLLDDICSHVSWS